MRSVTSAIRRAIALAFSDTSRFVGFSVFRMRNFERFRALRTALGIWVFNSSETGLYQCISSV